MKTFLILAFIGITATSVMAQEVSPIYAEGKIGKPVKGQFTVSNKTLQNLQVIIEPKQLVIVDGKSTFASLQPGTEVELKENSAVISPRSSRTFDYKLHCANECLVMFMNGMTTGQKTKEGVLIRLWIPSSVYLCTETKGCRERTKKSAGLQ
jgi:hypothetical protein